MAAAEQDAEPLGALVRRLRAELRWEPATGGESVAKRAFVDALTEISALPLDSMSMEVRRRLVAAEAEDDESARERGPAEEEGEEAPPPHLRRIAAALEARDVRLKCKAASALGSLCVSRVAGQRLLDVVGDRVLASLGRMARSRNQWAQADALAVLGWAAVVADARQLAAIAALVPAVLRALGRTVAPLLPPADRPGADRPGASRLDADARADPDAAAAAALAASASEQAATLRVYALVLLLNLSQRDAHTLEPHAAALADALSDLLRALLARRLGSPAVAVLGASEATELLRLAVATLSLLVGVLGGLCDRLLACRAVPVLLKLKRAEDEDNGSDSDLAARLGDLAGALLAR